MMMVTNQNRQILQLQHFKCFLLAFPLSIQYGFFLNTYAQISNLIYNTKDSNEIGSGIGVNFNFVLFEIICYFLNESASTIFWKYVLSWKYSTGIRAVHVSNTVAPVSIST